jgi:hypothetical protein
MTSIEMPEPVWQSLNAKADEVNTVASNLKFAMDCQKSEVEFLREAAHAIARLTFLAADIKRIIRECYIIRDDKGPKDSVTIFDLAGADMDEEAYEEDELENAIEKAEAYHDER